MQDRQVGLSRGTRIAAQFVSAALLTALLAAGPAVAATKQQHRQTHRQPTEAAVNPISSAIVLDAETGRILFQDQPDAQTYPASLTKMMTLYLTFQQLSQNKASLEQRLNVSDYAASMAPSKLDLRPGSTIRLEDAILGLVTRSANDAAVTIAENLGGSEDAFARQMTVTAQRLGMTRTRFANASGLPDPRQTTTARDMATLGLALIRDFPRYYPYFSTRSFTYGGRAIPNHNHLLGYVDGVDGIKTGFIRASGFNLVASAKRDGHRVVAAVLGGKSPGARDRLMAQLIEDGFDTIDEQRDQQMVAARRESRQKTQTAYAESALSKALEQTAEGDDEDKSMPAGQSAVLAPAPTIRAVSATPATTAQIAPAPKQVASIATLPVAPLNTKPQLAPVIAPSAPAQKPKSEGTWTIQVGAFSTDKAARDAASAAVKKLPNLLKNGPVLVIAGGGKAPYRARIGGLDQLRAAEACRQLQKRGTTCMVKSADDV